MENANYSEKNRQSSALAALVPQIMNAIGGGDRKTAQLLEQQRMNNEARTEDMNLRNFMRSIMSPSTGDISPELIAQQAQLFGVPPEKAIQAIGAFEQFKRAKRGDKVKAFKQMPSLPATPGQAAYGGAPEVGGWPGLPATPEIPGTPAQPGGIVSREFYQNEIPQGWTQGEFKESKQSNPNLFKTFNQDGSFTWAEKKLGASGLPEPDDRSFGWIGQSDGSKEYGELTPGTVSLPKPSTGMEITTGDGTTIKTGVPGNQSILTRGEKGNTQRTLKEANATYSNLKATINQYDDSFLMGKDKLGFAVDAFKEKWELGEVSPEEKQKLADYSKFKQESIATLNDYIKQITGAAMSAEEAKRLMKGMPNPGVGLFDGDSPTQFKSKMEGVMQKLDRTIARSNYVLRHGLKSYEEVPLGSMDRIIDKRGETIETKLKQQHPNKSIQEIEQMTKEALSKEFGIRF